MMVIDARLTSTDPVLEKMLMDIYQDLKAVLNRGDLAPSVRAHAMHALANVSQIVNDLDLAYEMLYDLGV